MSEQDKLDEYTLEKKKSYKVDGVYRHYRKRNGFDANWRHDSRPLQKKKRRSQKTVPEIDFSTVVKK
jgi:hypothetical protein